MVTALE